MQKKLLKLYLLGLAFVASAVAMITVLPPLISYRDDMVVAIGVLGLITVPILLAAIGRSIYTTLQHLPDEKESEQ